MLSVETRVWRRVVFDGPTSSLVLNAALEIHTSVSEGGVLTLDVRTIDDQRTIHRVPLRCATAPDSRAPTATSLQRA